MTNFALQLTSKTDIAFNVRDFAPMIPQPRGYTPEVMKYAGVSP